jgi:hypothetical protein
MLTSQERKNYIANLSVGAIHEGRGLRDDSVQALDMNALPNGLVTGSNLVQFPTAASGELKSSVALSLLLAQRVASTDTAIATPQQWIQKHNTVLTNLNWLDEGGGVVESKFNNINVAVHQAIIPFLTAAFGGALAAGSLIITALQQLQNMDKNSPWITLFDRQSQRFNVTEYMFTVVDIQGDLVRVSMASARLDASFGTIQVLFFKVTNQDAKFESASGKFSAQSGLITDMNSDLQTKLQALTRSFIASVPDAVLKAAAGN